MGIQQALVATLAAASVPTQIILVFGSSWTVPSDWNSSNNTIECIGAGFAGGGAYALRNNLSLTAGYPVSYHVGSTSNTASVASTWFSSTGTVLAAGSTSATGALASACVGNTKYSGGNFYYNGTTGGSGGAAGPHGAGANGTSSGGGAGDAGYGGAGGTMSSKDGSAGTEWGTAGSGGGGIALGGPTDGVGGLYGGGGRIGAPGVIVITYTP